MAISHVTTSSVSNDSASTSIVVPALSGVQNGDLLIAFVWMIGQPTISGVPSGWDDYGTIDSGANLRLAAYRRTAASESGTYTWNISTAFKNRGVIVAYRGAETAFADWASAAGVSGTSQTTPTVTVPESGWFVTAVAGRNAATGSETNWGINTGDIERFDDGSNAGSGQDVNGAVWDTGAVVAAAGDYNRTLTSTQSVGLAAMYSIALAPQAGVSGDLPWVVGAHQ